jgi:hypothetical protein
MEGDRYLSPRELDVCARSKLDLSVDSAFDYCLMEMGAFFCEGTVGSKVNPWNLRLRYNNGLNWLKENSEDNPKYKKAKEILNRISFDLTNCGIPLWEEEKTEGIHEELLCPEYLSMSEFVKRSRQVLVDA